jgi:hypothetical protein
MNEFRRYWIFTHSERRFCGTRNRHLDGKNPAWRSIKHEAQNKRLPCISHGYDKCHVTPKTPSKHPLARRGSRSEPQLIMWVSTERICRNHRWQVFLTFFFVAHLMLGWLLSEVTRGSNFSPRTLAALTQPSSRAG